MTTCKQLATYQQSVLILKWSVKPTTLWLIANATWQLLVFNFIVCCINWTLLVLFFHRSFKQWKFDKINRLSTNDVPMFTFMSSDDCNSFSFQFKRDFIFMFSVVRFYSFRCKCCVIYVLFREFGHKINCNNEPFLDARWFHYNQHNIVRNFMWKMRI